ncbi:MAG: zinc ABC transporter substrate-binding protein [Candidatus Omnitrophica bacterium]|nr:zinc ABC transporter substrate-binding protein [Candidatus Omnitrophota bacterium]
MKISLLTVLLLSATVAPANADTINVLTTTADLKAVVEAVGGKHVKVDTLGLGNQNYHFLQAKPSYMIKARRADLFVRVGLDLEIGYESLILEGSRNPDIQVGRPGHLDASEGIAALEIPDHVDRSMGDIHAHGNPHYWLDPVRMKIVAEHITVRLSQLAPQYAAEFKENYSELSGTIDRKMREWQERLSPYRKEKLISYHRSWSYFADRFGFDVVDELEPKPGVPPSPAHLRTIIDIVQKQQIKVILNENIYKEDAARYVSERTSAVVVSAPISVGGARGVTDYIALMDRIVDSVQAGFAQFGGPR